MTDVNGNLKLLIKLTITVLVTLCVSISLLQLPSFQIHKWHLLEKVDPRSVDKKTESLSKYQILPTITGYKDSSEESLKVNSKYSYFDKNGDRNYNSPEFFKKISEYLHSRDITSTMEYSSSGTMDKMVNTDETVSENKTPMTKILIHGTTDINHDNKSPGDSITFIVNPMVETTDDSKKTTVENSFKYLTKRKNWEAMMSDRFASRKDFLKQQCQRFGGNNTQISSRFFYYARDYNLLACISAKAGSSSWKSHFLKMNGYDKPYKHPHLNKLSKEIRASLMMTKEELNHRIYEKIETVRLISVRHPFSRLISAYTSKYYDGVPTIPTMDRAVFLKTPLEMMGKNFSTEVPVSIPFPVFIKFVLLQWKDKNLSLNAHWKPYSNNCQPCQVPYEYVVKLETLEEDLQYLILKLGIKDVDSTTRRNKSNGKKAQSYLKYFESLSRNTIRDLYTLYRDDFLLFGYEDL